MKDAVSLFLEYKEPKEIARTIKHSLDIGEDYIETFSRVIFFKGNFATSLRRL